VPHYSDVERIEYDWTKSVYGDISEIIPKDTPPPLGGFITVTQYQDANLYHDIITGHLLCHWYPALHEQKMPIGWLVL
jgi:hypothetical protein